MIGFAGLVSVCVVLSQAPAGPSGDATIRGGATGSEIVIKTTSRLAGAIDSLTWDGVEFIDSFDHGRQLQSASNLDAGRPFFPETFNPTEAGSRSDGAGPKSTSRLLKIEAKGDTLTTAILPAFWLRPGEKSEGHPAVNTEALSKHLIEKRVKIGRPGMPNVIEYDVTFTVPPGEGHTYAQFEGLTGYMPESFSTFLRFDSKSSKLVPLSDGPGEQPDPVVLSQPDGEHAMGIFSPDQPAPGFENAGYGRFRFDAAKVVKWNCVYRIRDREGIEPKTYTYRHFVAVGTREDVRKTIEALRAEFAEKGRTGEGR